MLYSLIKKGQTQDVGDITNFLVDMVQKIHGSVWKPETFAGLHMIVNEHMQHALQGPLGGGIRPQAEPHL